MACVFAMFLLLAASVNAQIPVDTGSIARTTVAHPSVSSSYFGFGGANRYDVAFRQASLREVLQFMSWIADINIVIPEGVDGVVNVSFRDITINDAINSITRANSLEYTIEGRVLRIGKPDQFRDTGEDLRTETFRLSYASATEMALKVKPLLSSRGSAIEDQRTNSIIIRELPANIDNVRRFVNDVDIKDAQVLIEAKILEATRQFSRDLGIQWGMTKGGDQSKLRVAGLSVLGQSDTGRNLNVNLPPNAPTSGILLGSFFKGMNIDMQILAAEQRGDIYVISDPSIVTSNGKSANIRSGSTLLIQGSSTVNIGTTTGGTTQAGGGLQQIETGIQLTVVPQISINDYVKLDIKVTTSTPDYTHAVQGVPVILDNTASTVVLVKDGETTVIGGLSRYSDSLTRKSVPYFSKIPVLGNLFKSKSRSRENSELMVFIKPTVIRVEGQAPAQVRVRELAERKEAMELEPVINPEKDAELAAKKEAVIKSRKANKYLRK